MNVSSRIELVIFDCDGVLIDSEIISAQILQREALEQGVDFSVDYVLNNFVGHSFSSVANEIERNFEIRLPQNFEESYRARLLKAFEQELTRCKDVKEVIEQLNCAYCVATSSSLPRVSRSLQLVGLSQLFDDIFTAEEVKRGKPAPDLFLFAADKMAVNPSNCLVIEDSIAGVTAGLAAKMHTARYTGGAHILHRDNSAGAQCVFDKFENFFDYYPELKLA